MRPEKHQSLDFYTLCYPWVTVLSLNISPNCYPQKCILLTPSSSFHELISFPMTFCCTVSNKHAFHLWDSSWGAQGPPWHRRLGRTCPKALMAFLSWLWLLVLFCFCFCFAEWSLSFSKRGGKISKRPVGRKKTDTEKRGISNDSDTAPQEEWRAQDLHLCFQDEKNVLHVCYFMIKPKVWSLPSGESPATELPAAFHGGSCTDCNELPQGGY